MQALSHTPISSQNKRTESYCLGLDTSPNAFRVELFFFFFLFKVLVFFGNHSDSAKDPDPNAASQELRQSSVSREALNQAVTARMLGACCTSSPPDSYGLGLDSASTSRAES